LGIFGIVGGPVLGAFTLGMFFPFANSLGAFVGCFSSLIFTMWMGFGQTVAKAAKTYDSARWSPTMPVSTENCPLAWFNYTLPEAKEPFAPFNHLELYEVSYMWFSAVAWAWCVVVGLILSLYKPTNHRRLDQRLISPALPKLFIMWPRVVRDWINNIYDETGADLDDVVKNNGVGAINMGFVGEKMKEKN